MHRALQLDHIAVDMLYIYHLLVCREDLLGAEVRLYAERPDSSGEWAEARIMALGANDDHPTEGMFSHKLVCDGGVCLKYCPP